jgi:starch phosphorylase
MDALNEITKEDLKERLIENVKTMFRKTLDTASNEQIYQAFAFTIRDIVTDKWIATQDTYNKRDVKLVYYLSMEFLMGRFLGNMVINLTMYDKVMEVMKELYLDYNFLEEAERDPGLGNGGLGRLAACFLDSLSTMEYPAYGCGIRYHYGIFEQDIVDGFQVERPDSWLEKGDIWGVKRDEYAKEVHFYGNVVSRKKPNGEYTFMLQNTQSVVAVPYDYPILGYGNNTVNTLRLWNAEAKNKFDLQSFNQGDYTKSIAEQGLANSISNVLYPADDQMVGKELRLKQQYFFISATLQRILDRYVKSHVRFDDLPNKVQLQLNDTHPTVAVAELMRLMVDVYSVPWDTAWEVTRKMCAYTNHTIMSEALEKWPVELFSRLLPRIYMIVEEINRRFCDLLITRFGNNPEKIRRMAVIADGQVRMAFLAIVGSHSVNGVAAIHTNILKKQELKDFYDIYPEKFNNKTNGITQRRWLMHCNPLLAALITEAIGDKWITDLSELAKLVPLSTEPAFQEKFMKVKRANKEKLSNYVRARMGVLIDPDSILDIQAKRLHEYKRQLLNVLHILDLYNKLRINPGLDITPRTFIFSAKAAASYRRAKLIIKLINSVADLINNDPSIEGRIKVLFLKNYGVSLAEKLVPAANVSEQISTAGKEASGTGNMKFMLNGAVTIGTLDGANVEMLDEVGDENIFIFGLKADEVIKLVQDNSYSPWDICNMSHSVRGVVTELINGTLSGGDDNLFRELYDALLNGYGGARPDEYFVLKDFEAYAEAQAKVDAAYKDRGRWARMAIMNVAKSGKFSSDRTIKQYAEEIWNLSPVHITL